MEELDSNDKLLCTLAYPIGYIIPIVLLVTKKENRACRYHAFNALFAQIAAMVIFVVLSIVIGILAHIPGLGCVAGIIGSAVLSVYWLAFLIYTIYLALEVQKGSYPTIPYITEFANKYIEG